MIKTSIKPISIFLIVAVLLLNQVTISQAYAATDNITEMSEEAFTYFMNGEYTQAVAIYDQILEIMPTNSDSFIMKGVALSNLRLQTTLAAQDRATIQYDPLELNKQSMLEFYKASQVDPYNIIALNGLGLGFGNFAEYEEAKKYWKDTLELEPNDSVAKNYLEYVEKIAKKYPVKSTIKPQYLLQLEENNIPYWIKNNAIWWSSGKIGDSDFIAGIQYLVENKIIKLSSQITQKTSSNSIPPWIKNSAGWWANNLISDGEFLAGIQYLIENGIIIVTNNEDSEILKKELDRKAWNFERYLTKIQNDIRNEKRYIEYPNPSAEVIKKYWKDYQKWNLDQYLLMSKDALPDREITLIDNVYHLKYSVYPNQQPNGLPLDHVSTLQNSFDFWEELELTATDGKKAFVEFDIVNSRADANIWVTWVVRNLGDGVLGHANLGKGVVEVALGGYGCDGSFQLFSVETVQLIMTHELGHSLGLGHSENSDNIMYSSIPEVNYAYCLLP